MWINETLTAVFQVYDFGDGTRQNVMLVKLLTEWCFLYNFVMLWFYYMKHFKLPCCYTKRLDWLTRSGVIGVCLQTRTQVLEGKLLLFREFQPSTWFFEISRTKCYYGVSKWSVAFVLVTEKLTRCLTVLSAFVLWIWRGIMTVSFVWVSVGIRDPCDGFLLIGKEE